MSHHETVRLAIWIHRTHDALVRLGVDTITAGAAFGLTPLVWLTRYDEGYQPTGAAILYAETYMQEFTR